jgi:uncharacterized protein (DUF2267 family)
MKRKTIDLVDHAIEKTYQWIDELHANLPWDDRLKTIRLLRATLHALRDWLPLNEATQLGAQLPTLIRGLYYESWRPQHKSEHPRNRDGFLTRIGSDMAPDVVFEIEDAVSIVFALLARHVSAGEIKDIRSNMPSDMKELWPIRRFARE